MATSSFADYSRELISIVRTSEWFMDALHTVSLLGLSSWCIGAGAVRNLVWDHLHGITTPSELPDVDVVHFDLSDLSPERDRALAATLTAQQPAIPWEVTNQAAVHLWYEQHFGFAVEPLSSLESALATWPEYATCVGISLDRQGALRVHAPHGLDDLFGLIVRRNPTRVDLKTYQHRIAAKRFQDRWPRVRVIPK